MDESLSKFAIKFNLRRYTEEVEEREPPEAPDAEEGGAGLGPEQNADGDGVGVGFGDGEGDKVGWCRLTLSNPNRKRLE